MTEPFGHGRLIVYQKGMRFVALRRNLLDRLTRRVSACDHLERAAESIQVNIAHGSSTTSAQERMMYLGHANGSALECAACLDVLAAKHLIAAGDTLPGKLLLAEIAAFCWLCTKPPQAVSENLPLDTTHEREICSITRTWTSINCH